MNATKSSRHVNLALPPDREVIANPAGVQAQEKTLGQRGVPDQVGKGWPTHAPYRETQPRGAVFQQALYGGDDLTGVEWNHRAW